MLPLLNIHASPGEKVIRDLLVSPIRPTSRRGLSASDKDADKKSKGHKHHHRKHSSHHASHDESDLDLFDDDIINMDSESITYTPAATLLLPLSKAQLGDKGAINNMGEEVCAPCGHIHENPALLDIYPK